ncbi:MAG: hypothetical protein IPL10_16050 [Bacteroidetes bacterium]|nr:hypothetical protein [Bacteroidota bacterium]
MTSYYIADMYQTYLHGYKPPKTTRIGIFLGNEKKWNGKPMKNGTIIHLPAKFDQHKFNSLDDYNAKNYLLDILHNTIIEHCDELDWDKTVFERSYNEVKEKGFEFVKTYPNIISRNKTNNGQVIVRKNIEQTNIYFLINNHEINIYSNNNRFWLDPWNNLNNSCKWFDNDTFGVLLGKGQFKLYYSVSKKSLSYLLIPKTFTQKELEEKYERLITHINASC